MKINNLLTKTQKRSIQAMGSGGPARMTKSGGFSLIEMLVSTFVFSLMVGTIAGLFITGIQGQRSILAQQKLIDETSDVMERMSRSLRMSAGACDSSGGSLPGNYFPNTGRNNSISFLNPLDPDPLNPDIFPCYTFSLNTSDPDRGVLEQQIGIAGDTIELTSGRINVESLQFEVFGDVTGTQPKVIISMRAKGAGLKPEQQSFINLQTTISQRNLNQ